MFLRPAAALQGRQETRRLAATVLRNGEYPPCYPITPLICHISEIVRELKRWSAVQARNYAAICPARLSGEQRYGRVQPLPAQIWPLPSLTPVIGPGMTFPAASQRMS